MSSSITNTGIDGFVSNIDSKQIVKTDVVNNNNNSTRSINDRMQMAEQLLLKSQKELQPAFREFIDCIRTILDLIESKCKFSPISGQLDSSSIDDDVMRLFQQMKTCLSFTETIALTGLRSSSLISNNTSINSDCKNSTQIDDALLPSTIPSSSVSSQLVKEADYGSEDDAEVSPLSLVSILSPSCPLLTRSKSSGLIEESCQSLPSASHQEISQSLGKLHMKRASAPSVRHKRSVYKFSSMDARINSKCDVQVLQNVQMLDAMLKSAPAVRCQSHATVSSQQHIRYPMIPCSPLLIHQQRILDTLLKLQQHNSILVNSQSNSLEMDLIRQKSDFISNQLQYAKSPLNIVAFHSDRIALVMTLIESSIFCRINPGVDLISHCPPSKSSPAIQASTDFFNYLTRLIESMVLETRSHSLRVNIIQRWIKIANKLRELRNFNSLKAIISALSLKSIRKLSTAWDSLSKKHWNMFEQLSKLMSEQDNYCNYRAEIDNHPIMSDRPCIPFLGVIIHDMTYLVAAKSSCVDPDLHRKTDIRINNIVTNFSRFQSQLDKYVSEDGRILECRSKHHFSSSFRRDRDDCLSEKSGYSCDPLFCAHYLLTRPYVLDDDLIKLTGSDNSSGVNSVITGQESHFSSPCPKRAQFPPLNQEQISKSSRLIDRIWGTTTRSNKQSHERDLPALPSLAFAEIMPTRQDDFKVVKRQRSKTWDGSNMKN